MSDVIIRKKNEVYLQVKTPPHITYELSDHFTFEVEGAKFMPAYRNRHWDGKIRLFSPGTGEIYAGLREYIEQFCQERGYSISYLDNEFFGMPDEENEFILNSIKKSIGISRSIVEPKIDMRSTNRGSSNKHSQ